MNLRTIRGPELSAVDLQTILRLRAEVFVVEQQSPYLDVDGRDLEPGTTHYLIEDGALLAYARTLTEPDGERRIGRVVTAKDARGSGLGEKVMAAAVTDLGDARSVLEAQTYAQGFYARFGYVAEGEEYIEDGIPHITMRRAAHTG
ncbi:GNAT family N-acetyltransferase [Actinocrispum sp. NPDC049592]|uniref:GNAT family N-acetyltransferase n=1 Tax=Actinocrispum sp. NPDC049592 TaxID=3154835 RepID=UPI00343FD94E